MSMQVVNIPTMSAMIKHVGVAMREPLMFWGAPGVGKSEGVKQVAAELGAVMVDIRLSQYDSVDLRGIPVPTSDGLTTWHAPATLPFKGNRKFDEDEGLIFLFLDEINAAAPAVAAVAYQLVNDRAVGEHELMSNVVVIAAGNRDGDRGVTNRMPTPLANRFTHAEIGLDVDAWCFWAQQAGLPSEGVAFMQFRKPLLSTFDPSKPDKAFATPRSWSKALRYYKAPMPQDVKLAAMAGAIGEGPSAEFWGFIEVYQKMTPISEIIAKPDKVALPDEMSLRYATTVSVSGAMNTENIDALQIYLERLDPEFTVLAWHLAIARDKTIMKTNAFVHKYSKKFRAIFQA